VDCYAWSSSPLRRYVDLVNQMQLLATVRGTPAPFPERGQELLGIVRQFEAAYATYQEFQRHMERYWCLRWLRQHRVERLVATVLRDDLVRCERLPIVTKVPSLPPTDAGQRVELEVERIDLVEMELRLRFRRLLTQEESPDPTAAPLVLEP
jgi:exoribonuclease-2